MRGGKPLDCCNVRYEPLRQLREADLSQNDEERDVMIYHRCQLIRSVPDASIVTDRDQSVLAHVLQPNFIGRVFGESIVESFHRQACRRERIRKMLSEIAIREVADAQAARSYITASMTSWSWRP